MENIIFVSSWFWDGPWGPWQQLSLKFANKYKVLYLEPIVSIKNAKKLKGKFAPFSESVNKTPKSLKIKAIYNLKEQLKNFFLIIVRNYSKQPKIRYFLAISLASQSSDFLVSLAKNFASKNDLKLIQYSIYPKTLRIPLLALKELKTVENYSNSIELLNAFRTNFQKTLVKLKNLVEKK